MKIKFKFNSRCKYDVDVTPSRVAVWEHYQPYINGTGIFNLYDKTQFTTKGSSLSKKLRFESLYNNLAQTISNYKARVETNNEEFSSVECGAGVALDSARLIATMMKRAEINSKSFDVYDTFEGLPESSFQPDLSDLKGLFSGSLENFKKQMSGFDFVKPVQGLIPDSLPIDDPKKYDFVHIDLDLYEGTIGALNHFYPRLKKMGIIQLDDYNTNPWVGVNKAVDEYLSHLAPNAFFFQPIPLGGGFILKIEDAVHT